MIDEKNKEWGKEIWMANNEKYCGKKLILEKGKRCSFHYHKNKDETFYIDKGRILMEIKGLALRESGMCYLDKEFVMKSGESIRIFPGTMHRFSGLEKSVIIEISTHHEENDSYRFELSGNIPKEILKKYKI
jgi:mannose-6-phosphate isomerase-like protein (cupin superfamily)